MALFNRDIRKDTQRCITSVNSSQLLRTMKNFLSCTNQFTIHKLVVHNAMRTWEDCNTAEVHILLWTFHMNLIENLVCQRSFFPSWSVTMKMPWGQAVWRGSADMCLKTSEESSDGLGLVSSSKIAFQHCISSGKRFQVACVSVELS